MKTRSTAHVADPELRLYHDLLELKDRINDKKSLNDIVWGPEDNLSEQEKEKSTSSSSFGMPITSPCIVFDDVDPNFCVCLLVIYRGKKYRKKKSEAERSEIIRILHGSDGGFEYESETENGKRKTFNDMWNELDSLMKRRFSVPIRTDKSLSQSKPGPFGAVVSVACYPQLGFNSYVDIFTISLEGVPGKYINNDPVSANKNLSLSQELVDCIYTYNYDRMKKSSEKADISAPLRDFILKPLLSVLESFLGEKRRYRKKNQRPAPDKPAWANANRDAVPKTLRLSNEENEIALARAKSLDLDFSNYMRSLIRADASGEVLGTSGIKAQFHEAGTFGDGLRNLQKSERPHLWNRREEIGDQDLTPPEYIEKHYGQYLDGSVGRADIAEIDPHLIKAFLNWTRRRQVPDGFELPTETEKLQSEIQEFEAGRYLPDDVENIKRVVRAADRLKYGK